MMRVRTALVLAASLLIVTGSAAFAQRDASFLAPSAVSSGAVSRADGAVGIEPKNEIDLGETGVNVAKRTTIFFTNLTNLPIEIVSIRANGDSSVDAAIVADDCSKEGRIAPSSRCSVSVEVTPKGSGLWTAEVLMTHNGAGRLARAKLNGKTGASSEKKDTGLALSTKDSKPVDFGDVTIKTGKAVRSALMVNDSNEMITIMSIEVIAPENGLQRLEQGCMEDMDLKPGESCPVTMVWKPDQVGAISTDLIIRHSGRLGFAVIPLRGDAKEPKVVDKGTDKSALAKTATGKGGDVVSLSPTAEELERAMSGTIKPVSASDLPPSGGEDEPAVKKEPVDMSGDFHLIGTVGNRALLYGPGGKTTVLGVGDEALVGESEKVKLLSVTAKQAEIFVSGVKKVLSLETVSELTSKAAKSRQEKKSQASGSTTKKSTTSSTKPTVPASPKSDK